MFFVLACFRFGACAPSPCAKCAPNQPKTAPAIHRGATERTPPARCAAPPRAFQFPRSAPRLPFCLPPLLPVCLPACLAFCPSARLPLGRLASATPRRAPLPARTATPRPIAADRRARVQITPSERRTAPHGMARPSALDIPLCARPRPAVKLAPQRIGGGIRDICHQPPRIPRINVARQLRYS